MQISCRPLQTEEDYIAFDKLLLYCQQHGLAFMTMRRSDKIIIDIPDRGNVIAYDELKDYLEKQHGEYTISTS